MTSTTKKFNTSDIITTTTDLYESIPITGSVVSGAYAEPDQANSNVKSYTHGMFQSVYDYPHLSSSANLLFDVTAGFSGDSTLEAAASASATAAVKTARTKKMNMYNQMSQLLVGYDTTGSHRSFDQDGNLSSGTKYNDVVFLAFSRVFTKDSIQKGSYTMKVGINSGYSTSTAYSDYLVIDDTGAATNHLVNSPAGEYGILKVTGEYTSGTLNTPSTSIESMAGLIYYDAGIVVLSKEIFNAYHSSTNTAGKIGSGSSSDCEFGSASGTANSVLQDGTIDDFATAFRNRLINISFNNTAELNSTIYHCRVSGNDFNYSTNPTYLDNSKIRVKENGTDAPVSYVTGVGLYSENNELLAVAKLSQPIKNSLDKDFTIKVRLDY